MPELAEPRVDPAAMLMNAEGKLVSPEKKSKGKPCEIDLSLQQRVKAGSVTSTSQEKVTKSDDDVLFKLKLNGPQPVIAELRKDPNEALANAAAEKEAEVLKL